MTQPELPSGDRRSNVALSKVVATDIPNADFLIEPFAEPVTLRDRLAVIRRHMGIVLMTGAITAALSGYWAYKAVPIYRAVSTVQLSDTRSNLTSGIGSQVAPRTSWTVDPVKSRLSLLTSRSTVEEAVSKGKLQLRDLTVPGSVDWISNVAGAKVVSLDPSRDASRDTLRLRFTAATVSAAMREKNAEAPYGAPIDIGGLRFTVFAKPAGDSAIFEVWPYEKMIARLQQDIQSLRRPETDIADIWYDHPDGHYAQRVLNAMTLSFQALNMRAEQEMARRRREFLDQQVKSTDSVLETQRAMLSAFRSSTQIFSSKDRIAAEQTSLMNIRQRRAEMQADRQVFVNLLNKARSNQGAGEGDAMRALVSSPQVAENPVITQLYKQLSALRLTRDSLTMGPFASAPTNPDVLRLTDMIKSTAAQLAGAVQSQIESIDARIGALDALTTQSASAASQLPRGEAEEARLLQEADGTAKMSEQLREEQQRARISEVAQGGEVEVIDLAQLPVTPIDRGLIRRIIFATLLGLIIGAGLALLVDALSPSLKQSSEVERILALPTLGAIPKLNGAVHSRTRLQIRVPLRTALVQRSNGTQTDRPVNPEAPAFESFRALRTSLIFSNAVQSLKTMMVTSAAPADGKSMTAANLAAALSEGPSRVLLVDCDLRRGRLHKVFGLERTPGLTNVILGETDLESAVQRTAIPDLFLLATGTMPPNPTQLFSSSTGRALLTSLANTFDFVILDTPPVLAAADAAVLASAVDGVLLVVRIGATDRRAAKRAHDKLRAVGARILGTVLNDPSDMLGSASEYYYPYAEGVAAR